MIFHIWYCSGSGYCPDHSLPHLSGGLSQVQQKHSAVICRTSTIPPATVYTVAFREENTRSPDQAYRRDSWSYSLLQLISWCSHSHNIFISIRTVSNHLTSVGPTPSQTSDLPCNLNPVLHHRHQPNLLDKESISANCKLLCRTSNSRLGSHDKNLPGNIQTPWKS